MIAETHVFGEFKMKNVILSAGGPLRVYSVPDKIADNLEGACWYFRSIWIYDSPENKRFIINGVTRYNDKDFIDCLNNWETPEHNSILVEELDSFEPLVSVNVL